MFAVDTKRMKDAKVVVLIPVYNEEKTIGAVIKEIPRKISGVAEVKVLVMDDHSSDNTAKVAEQVGADYIFTNKKNSGLGVNFKNGIEQALKLGADIIVNIDGDGQFDPKEIPLLINPIITNGADMVTGSRFLSDSLTRDMTMMKKWGNRRFTKLISRIITKNLFSE